MDAIDYSLKPQRAQRIWNSNEISEKIIGAAIQVHTTLGPGLLESTYEACLKYELQKRGLKVLSQVGLPVIYDGMKIDWDTGWIFLWKIP